MGTKGNPRRPIKRQRRVIAEIKKAYGRAARIIGALAEDLAQDICFKMQLEGQIERFWKIPPNSILDRRGIDLVCETKRGFFFLNVKRSLTGVRKFSDNSNSKQHRHLVYPWRVGIYAYEKEEVKTRLVEILEREEPSYTRLPSEIKQELERPTYLV